MTTHIELKNGDNDNAKKWGGKILDETPFYTVKNLQEDLKSVGTFTVVEDGIFGSKTEKSLKLFQWVCINMSHCLEKKTQITRIKTANILVNGKLTKKAYDELAAWIKNGKEVTGDLIRIDFSELSNIEAGPNFKKTSSIKVQKYELVISKAAKKLITDMNAKAKDKKVTIKINQSLRENKVKVSGAVVTPATKSQHLIGHALDCNIVDGENWNSSATFKKKQETANAKAVVKAMKDAGYRWGGDFIPVDTPHFDFRLNHNTFDYEAKFFLNQRMVSLLQQIKKETP